MEYDDRGYGSRQYDMDDYGRERDDYGRESYEPAPQRAPRKKKKRSKFSRFMRALGKYLAQMPAQTFVVIGGSVAVVLVAVILLIVLLPGGAKKDPQEAMGDLTLQDMTPTPSLAPTNTPGPTAEPVETPDPDPLDGYTIATVGERHPAVPGVQERLVTLGYMDMPSGGVYTDLFGPATKNGIRRFQMRNIENYKDWDGQIGPATYNLLMSDDAKGFWYKKRDTDDKLYVDTIDGVKQPGLVTKLQNRLVALGYLAAGSVTGNYGDDTIKAVKEFQQYHGLTPVDGLAGQATLKLLYSAEAMDAVTGAANDRSKLLTPAPETDAAAAPETSDDAAAAPAA